VNYGFFALRKLTYYSLIYLFVLKRLSISKLRRHRKAANNNCITPTIIWMVIINSCSYRALQ